ncbi:DUF1097 domain-containing protein [Mesobacillus maritimus]|uniref:DUF1097 domain-containing protein n=1 Tax=Mesobacillus maritimus TaxID=1643336 RepID=A0ABS7KB72_9BACI|nr:DUF1097 domain-containing protein [Mesobacillus maritimus]MBY0099523.1 DUF1097 domain-containing protein [Mesobacillus maritimus]
MASIIATGLLCGLWTLISTPLGLLGWAGFAGCTTYFTLGAGGSKDMRKAMLCNIAGVGCGMLILLLTNMTGIPNGAAIFSGLVTCLMCVLGAKVLPINYTPGIFMGCFSTFAANGNWLILVISLVCGAVLGFLCTKLGAAFSIWGQRFLPKHDQMVTSKLKN